MGFRQDYGYGYKKSGDGTMYLPCAWCERIFRVYRHYQRNGAKYCSRACSWAGQRAIARAWADGRLDKLLREERTKARLESQERAKARRPINWCEAVEKGLETERERQTRELGTPLE